MTEIQPYIPPTDSWVAVIEPVGDLANKIADTDFVPKEFRRKPAAVAAAIMYGREIGLQPMSSLRSVNVIHGTPSLESEAMRALILSHGHHLRFVETTATRCIMEGCRRGSEDWTRVAYTMDEANQSGDAKKNPNYRSRPQEMMIARATSRLARMVFADVIGGLATPEEIDTAGEAPPPASPQTVTVKQEKHKAVKSRSPRKVKTETPQPEDGPQDGPPLPGEPGYNVESEPVDTETGEILDAEVVEDEPETLEIVPESDDSEPESDTKQPLTADQSHRITVALKALELGKVDGLALYSEVCGRPVKATRDLSRTEAGLVLAHLETMTNG
jgi:hypothetical protein